MSMATYNFSNEEHYMESARYKYYNSKEFREMIEQLNVKMEVIDGRIILTGSQTNLEQIEAGFEEFKRDYMQPGDSRNYRQEMVRQELSALEKGSLDDILSTKYELTNQEIKQRNTMKALNKLNIDKEILSKEDAEEELEEEIEEIRERIKRKQRQFLEKIKKDEGRLKDKVELILNKVITDPDEIGTIQEQIDNLNQDLDTLKGRMPFVNDFIEDIDREFKELEAKTERYKDIQKQKEELKEIQKQKEEYDKEMEKQKEIEEQEEDEEDLVVFGRRIPY